MASYTIQLTLDDSSVEEIAADLEEAINQHGLLGGNFFVEEKSQDNKWFWMLKLIHDRTKKN